MSDKDKKADARSSSPLAQQVSCLSQLFISWFHFSSVLILVSFQGTQEAKIEAKIAQVEAEIAQAEAEIAQAKAEIRRAPKKLVPSLIKNLDSLIKFKDSLMDSLAKLMGKYLFVS